jgi:hypothetical protein
MKTYRAKVLHHHRVLRQFDFRGSTGARFAHDHTRSGHPRGPAIRRPCAWAKQFRVPHKPRHGANEANFFVVRSPVDRSCRSYPARCTDSSIIASDGNVGIGTRSPHKSVSQLATLMSVALIANRTNCLDVVFPLMVRQDNRIIVNSVSLSSLQEARAGAHYGLTSGSVGISTRPTSPVGERNRQAWGAGMSFLMNV